MGLIGRALQIGIILTFSAQVFADAVPGEYVVRLKPGLIAFNSKTQLADILGSSIKKIMHRQNIVVVKRPVFETTESAIKYLASADGVEVVEPNFIYHISKKPNDPLLGHLWGLKNVGQKDSDGTVGVVGVDIGVEKAWDIETGSNRMIIAVIDTGVDYTHPDLAGNLWTNYAELNGVAGVDDDNNGVIDDIHGYNAIDNSGNAKDDHGHGSHCSGTIAAKGNDGKGIVGVNWDAQIMAVKFLDKDGSGTLENAILAIDYATKMGAHIMSNSWGGGGKSQTLLEAIQRSNEAGALFVAAAGNDGGNNDQKETYPANYAVDNVIAVAAINNVGDKAGFSNYGKRTVHLGAPGVNVYSSTGGTYDSWSGTSMAAPHVSGVAALLWSHESKMTALEIKERLVTTTRPLTSLRGKTISGGMVNAYNALTNKTTPRDPNDPANWASQSLQISSASPYLKNTDEIFDVKIPGVKEISIYFETIETEQNYDTVQIIDAKGVVVQTISGKDYDLFSTTVSGDSAQIKFKTDGSVEKSGWKVTKAAYR